MVSKAFSYVVPEEVPGFISTLDSSSSLWRTCLANSLKESLVSLTTSNISATTGPVVSIVRGSTMGCNFVGFCACLVVWLCLDSNSGSS
jgi:hypothetical protein